MNDIVFERGEGGLGRVANGDDHWSGFLFKGTKPVAFGTDNVKQYFTLADVEADGIVATGTTAVWHYMLSEFFRQQPDTGVYVGIFAVLTASFDEVVEIQNFAEGKIRQMAVYLTEDFIPAMITTLQARATQLRGEHKNLVILLGANVDANTINSLPDLSTLQSPNVSVIIGQDAEGTGGALYTSTTFSVPCLGCALGVVALSAVHENIGWVAKFNVLGEGQLDKLAFADGTLYRNLTKAQLDAIHAKKYIFLCKKEGIAGSYFNDSFSATTSTSDFATIENNRTMDKAERGIRTTLLPQLNSPLRVNATTGELSAGVAKFFENEASKTLTAMLAAGEISGFSVKVNPKQNVLSNSKVIVEVKIVPVGVAREIEVRIGFAVRT